MPPPEESDAFLSKYAGPLALGSLLIAISTFSLGVSGAFGFSAAKIAVLKEDISDLKTYVGSVRRPPPPRVGKPEVEVGPDGVPIVLTSVSGIAVGRSELLRTFGTSTKSEASRARLTVYDKDGAEIPGRGYSALIKADEWRNGTYEIPMTADSSGTPYLPPNAREAEITLSLIAMVENKDDDSLRRIRRLTVRNRVALPPGGMKIVGAEFSGDDALRVQVAYHLRDGETILPESGHRVIAMSMADEDGYVKDPDTIPKATRFSVPVLVPTGLTGPTHTASGAADPFWITTSISKGDLDVSSYPYVYIHLQLAARRIDTSKLVESHLLEADFRWVAE